MGINTLNNEFYGLSLTLGGGEVTLLDMAYAYSVFANSGVMAGEPVPAEDLKAGFRELNPVSILKIQDAQGNVIYEYTEPRRKEVLRPQLAYMITDILSDRLPAPSPSPGTARSASTPMSPSRPGHDGLSRRLDHRLHNAGSRRGVGWQQRQHGDDEHARQPRSRAYLARVMDWLLARLPETEFQRPDGMERVTVDAASGLLPTEYSPKTVRELFIQGAAPTDYDNIHRPFRICQVSGKLATAFCPAETIVQQVYDIYPPKPATGCVRARSRNPRRPIATCMVPVLPQWTWLSPVRPFTATSQGSYRSSAMHAPATSGYTNCSTARESTHRSGYPSVATIMDRVDNNILEYWDVSQMPMACTPWSWA